MVSVFKFWHLKSDKKLAKMDKKAAGEIRKSEKLTGNIKDKIAKDIANADIDAVYKDILSFLNSIRVEEQDLIRIDKNAQIQEYDLLKRIEDVEKLIERVSIKDKRIEEQLEEIVKLKEEIHNLIAKAKTDARRLKRDRETILVKLAEIKSGTRRAKRIRKLEKWIRKNIKKEIQIEKLIEDAVKSIEKTAGTEEMKKYVGDLYILTKKFIEDARKEAEEIYEIEYNDVLLSFGVHREMEYLQKLFKELEEKGFPRDKERELWNYFKRIEQELEASERELYKMEKYLVRKT